MGWQFHHQDIRYYICVEQEHGLLFQPETIRIRGQDVQCQLPEILHMPGPKQELLHRDPAQ